MPSIYVPALRVDKRFLTIESQEFHHLINVKRIGIGEKVKLNNGTGLIAEGKLTEIRKNSAEIESICTKAQSLIDAEDYKGANEILADIQELVKDIPVETMQKESIDDLFAAKGFVLYQMKEFCEAKKFFKEATKINPKNETAIHYLNDIRVRDCNKFVRHV